MRRTLALLVLLAIPAVARAQTPPDAEALLREGVDLRRAGRDAEARDRFTEALRAAPSARAWAQLGFAEQALGRWPEAAAAVRRALDAPDDWVAARRVAVDGAWATIRAAVCRVAVEGPAGTRVEVDASEVGVLPLAGPLWRAAGPVRVALRAPDGRTLVDAFEARGGGDHTVRLPALAPAPVSARASVPAPVGTEAVATSGARVHPATWVLAGLGAAGIAAGVALLTSRNGVAAAYNDADCLRGTATRDDTCGGLRSDVEAREAWAALAFGTGGALAAAALVVGLVVRPSAAVRVRAGVGFVTLVGRF